MMLLSHTGREISGEVRRLLIARGQVDPSPVACRIWTRRFIQGLLPRWTPGTVLTWDEAVLVGNRFLMRLKLECGRSYDR